MIHAVIEIQGEPDTVPHTMTLQFQDKSDELVFYESVKMINERIGKKLKININETVSVFVGYIVTELRNGKTKGAVESGLKKLLSADDVLIGVAESLRYVSFSVTLDGLPKSVISVQAPIPISEYVMGT